MAASRQPKEQLKAPNLADLVAERLCVWILEGQFAPGDQLPSEHELVKRFGVARSVVREAVVRLRTLNIIEVLHGKGAFVLEVPLELLNLRIRRLTNGTYLDLMYLWEVREALEVSIADLAAQRRTTEDLLNLERAITAMDEAVAQGNIGVAEDANFHLYLTSATHNPFLVQVMEDIAVLIAPSRLRSLERPNRPATSNTEHRLIFSAVQEGDGGTAREAMKQHLSHGKRLTTEAV